MKIIQSFWTKPLLHTISNDQDCRYNGGWLDLKFYFMSWAFSALQLSKYYDNVELITDKKGKNFLFDALELPYSNVSTHLDSIEDYHPALWALGKIIAYSMQREPFLHVDGDAYIWGRFPKSIEQAEIAVQHRELGYPYYREVFDLLKQSVDFIPDCILDYEREFKSVNAYNLGITGGQNHGFFTRYSTAAFEFVNKNLAKFNKNPLGQFNTFYEQVLLYCMSAEAGIKVKPLFNLTDQVELYMRISGFLKFKAAPKKVKYIHLFGLDCKMDPSYCEELENRLLRLYPAYHRKVIALVGELQKEHRHLFQAV